MWWKKIKDKKEKKKQKKTLLFETYRSTRPDKDMQQSSAALAYSSCGWASLTNSDYRKKSYQIYYIKNFNL